MTDLDALLSEADRISTTDAGRYPSLIHHLATRLRELKAENDDLHTLTQSQAEKLTAIVNTIKGAPGPLKRWSHHDAPDLVRRLVESLALSVGEELDAAREGEK